MFTLRGIGTVVTGTLWSGTIGEGDELRVEPPGLDVRVRSVQVHDRAVERAEAGQRVAVALPGIERDRIARGDALVAAGRVSRHLPAGRSARGARATFPAAVTVHLGTADVPARVARSGRYAQLRLERPLVAARGDRVVLRTALDRRRGRRPRSPAAAAPRSRPARAHRAGRDRSDRLRPGRAIETLSHLGELEGVERAGDWVFSPDWLEELREQTSARASRRPTRATPGSTHPSAPWAAAIVPLLGLERRGSRLYLPGATAQTDGADELLAELEAVGVRRR